MPQPILTVSNIHDTTHDISLLSDTSNFDLISSQFSSPNAAQIANNPFNPPQEPITNIEHLLSQAHWNHSSNIVNSSRSFQCSLPFNFWVHQPIITLSSNSPTPDPDQYSHHCIGKKPDTTRPYPTLSLKLDPKCIVSTSHLFGDHNNGKQLHNWSKERISKSYKITQVQKQRAHKSLKQSKTTFSVGIIVRHHLYFE